MVLSWFCPKSRISLCTLRSSVSSPEARTEMNVLLDHLLETQSSTGPKKAIAVDQINEIELPIEAWMFIGMVLGATDCEKPLAVSDQDQCRRPSYWLVCRSCYETRNDWCDDVFPDVLFVRNVIPDLKPHNLTTTPIHHHAICMSD